MSRIDYGALASKAANSLGKVTRKIVDTGVSLVDPENLKAVGEGVKNVAGSVAEGWKTAGEESNTKDPLVSVSEAAKTAGEAIKTKVNDVKKGFEQPEDTTEQADATSEDKPADPSVNVHDDLPDV
jgi:hypothetical protein